MTKVRYLNPFIQFHLCIIVVIIVIILPQCFPFSPLFLNPFLLFNYLLLKPLLLPTSDHIVTHRTLSTFQVTTHPLLPFKHRPPRRNTAHGSLLRRGIQRCPLLPLRHRTVTILLPLFLLPGYSLKLLRQRVLPELRLREGSRSCGGDRR